ncbi:MAG: formate dehydrogenase subunit gamma [Betaproteobacteria bacterium]|nr:formate dehydrogenase subunit gamma [Betaproteobacteria bacterium]
MKPISVLWRGVFALALLLYFANDPALAQSPQETAAQRQQTQPYNNAPVWREVRKEGQEHFTTTRGREAGVLIQTYGQTWRELRNSWIVPIAGWLIIAFACAIGLFYWGRGPIKVREGPTGRLIHRFTPLERGTHWTMAISFCLLGISGLITMAGKYVLLPVIGYTLFSWLAEIAKTLHNFLGPVFLASAVVFIVLYIKDMLPRRYDFTWFLKGGGMLTGEHIPSGKFNAGEKLWFWGGVVVLAFVVCVSGLILDFPNFDQSRLVMIIASITHSVAAGFMIALSFFHIYMGSIGVEGAYEGMRYGYVDESWAKEHHAFWYEDVKSGRIQAGSAEGTPEAPRLAPASRDST